MGNRARASLWSHEPAHPARCFGNGAALSFAKRTPCLPARGDLQGVGNVDTSSGQFSRKHCREIPAQQLPGPMDEFIELLISLAPRAVEIAVPG